MLLVKHTIHVSGREGNVVNERDAKKSFAGENFAQTYLSNTNVHCYILSSVYVKTLVRSLNDDEILTNDLHKHDHMSIHPKSLPSRILTKGQ